MDERRPQASNLLGRGGADVEARDDGPESPAGCDCLKAGDTRPKNERLARRDRAGSRCQHREEPDGDAGGFQRRLVTRDRGLRGEGVDPLGAGDARHQFEGQRCGSLSSHLGHVAGAFEGLEETDDHSIAGEVGREIDGSHERAAEGSVPVRSGGTGRPVRRIGESGLSPGSFLDNDGVSALYQFRNDWRCQGHPSLTRCYFGGYSNFHRHPWWHAGTGFRFKAFSLFGGICATLPGDDLPMTNWLSDPNVVYTRGLGCAELAELLSSSATRVAGDLAKACLESRADLLVTRKPPGGFDLVSVAVPLDFQPTEIKAVVAAVAGGPHSELNVSLAEAIGHRLGVETFAATAYFAEAAEAEAHQTLDRVAAELPEMSRLVIGADDPTAFIAKLPERSLLILGEPGGTLLSRLFFGPGARLKAKAPAGAVMVRYAPPRVFQSMSDPVFFGPLHHAGDSLRLHDCALTAVVDNGVLVGVVRRSILESADPEVTLSELMDAPISVPWDLSIDQLDGNLAHGVGPIPVIDDAGRLIGALNTVPR